MALNVSYLQYGYAIDTANLKDNIKLVCDNAASKTANTAHEIVNQSNNSTNSALLSEYAQNIAKSNVAQQFALDNNLKETLKFLKDEATKNRVERSKKYKFVIQEIFNDGGIFDFDKEEQERTSEENIDNLESYNIVINENMKNIFAA